MPVDPRFWDQVILQTLTLFVLLVGWLGVLIPVFPGLIVMWLATFAYALLENAAGRMAWNDWALFGLITLLMIFGNVIDNIIIARKMRGRAIPWSSILVAWLAGIIASLFLTPVLGIVASPLCLFAAESMRLHSRRSGFESAKAYMLAWGWSFAVISAIGAAMIVIWILWAFY